MTTGKYVLDENGQPVIENNLMTWARWFEKRERHLADDRLENGLRVSTVFLGLDHNYCLDGPPILWETMIFDADEESELSGYQQRYATREEAEAGHKEALELAKQYRRAAGTERV